MNSEIAKVVGSLVRSLSSGRAPDLISHRQPDDLTDRRLKEHGSQFKDPKAQQLVEEVLYMAPHGEL